MQELPIPDATFLDGDANTFSGKKCNNLGIEDLCNPYPLWRVQHKFGCLQKFPYYRLVL